MIGPAEFGDAIEAGLQALFPGEPVYRDLAPEGFKRPACEVECESFGLSSADAGTVELTLVMLVRVFVAVDAYHHSQFNALYRKALRVLGLFAAGYLKVSDSDTGQTRAARCDAAAAPVTGLDFAEVRATFQLMLSREELGPDTPADPPLMEEIRMAGDVRDVWR